MQVIVQRLRAENMNQAGGRVQSGRQEFLVRTVNQFQSLDDIGNIYIATRNGAPIQLQDIAEIRSGFKDRTSISRVNGRESIELNLYREGDANTVLVADAVRARLPQIQRTLPSGYEIEVLADQSTFIRNAIQAVKSNAVVGGLLAMGVILLFLRQLGPTIIISLAIPVSIIATFFFMFMTGLSLNLMSLGGIALAVGLLVDNAIVVLENIDRRKQLGDDQKNCGGARHARSYRCCHCGNPDHACSVHSSHLRERHGRSIVHRPSFDRQLRPHCVTVCRIKFNSHAR